MVQMLDADDVILEQAMQTGAALKRARDLQKAARKPKVTPHALKLLSRRSDRASQIFLLFCLHAV